MRVGRLQLHNRTQGFATDPVVPHNLCMSMFSTSSVNVIGFDPNKNTDQARAYAAKYCSSTGCSINTDGSFCALVMLFFLLTVRWRRKAEKSFFLETTRKDDPKNNDNSNNAAKAWLQCRTTGKATAWNRLLNFHIVRSTKAVVFTTPSFVQEPGDSSLRFAEHLAANPEYPEPMNYLTFIGKFFFRNARLRHLRIEQFNRYCTIMGEASAGTIALTSENTIDDDDCETAYRVLDADHRNYDPVLEGTAIGTIFPASAPGVPSARRRHDQRLGVSRIPCLEISGSGREGFYQQKLLLSLPWYCPEPIKSIMIDGKETLEWTFRCDPPTEDQIGARLPSEVLKVTTVSEGRFSFEEYCKRLEASYTDAELGVVCLCCSGVANSSGKCDSCRYATGWHRCHANGRTRGNDVLKWRAGTLHSGHLDVQRCLFNLHRRHLAF